MKRYDELFLSYKQHLSIVEGVPGHNHGQEDCEYVIGRSQMYYVQPEDEREVWWGKLPSGEGLKVVVSAGISDNGSRYGVIVTACEEERPDWWYCL